MNVVEVVSTTVIIFVLVPGARRVVGRFRLVF